MTALNFLATIPAPVRVLLLAGLLALFFGAVRSIWTLPPKVVRGYRVPRVSSPEARKMLSNKQTPLRSGLTEKQLAAQKVTDQQSLNLPPATGDS